MTREKDRRKDKSSAYRQRETIRREVAAAAWHVDRSWALMELVRQGINGRPRRDQLIAAAFLASGRALPDLAKLQAEYREAYARLYSPGFLDEVQRLKRREPTGIEYVLAFLEADPWHFRSGYLKSDLVRYLRRVDLTDDDRERLRAVIIAAWQKGPRTEYREYLRLARYLDSPEFRADLETLAASPDASKAERAKQALVSMRRRPRNE